MVKKYTPNEKEKYMCEKHKNYFKKRLLEWKNEIVEANTKGLYLKEVDSEISSADRVWLPKNCPATGWRRKSSAFGGTTLNPT